MKYILILAFFVFSVDAFSQVLIKQNIDENGVPFENDLSRLNGDFYSDSRAMTTFSYDTVRALSEINDPSNADAYPWISPDGLRLYYTSGAFNNGLMFTQRSDTSSYFQIPVLVPVSVSSPASYWLSSDELDVYVCTSSSELYYSHRNTISSSFGTPVLINLSGVSGYSIKGASLNFTQNILFVCVFSAPSKIMEFARTSPTSFNYVRALPTPLAYNPTPGQLSKDELTYFLGCKNGTGRASLFQLTRTVTTDTFALGTFQQIQGINDTTVVANSQPSMSDSLNWIVFVRANINSWTANDLFIAHKGITTCVFEPSEKKINISVFPNPSNGKFSIHAEGLSGEGIEKFSIEIINMFGKKVQQQVSEEIDLSDFPKGIYLLKIYSGRKIYNKKIIVQ